MEWGQQKQYECYRYLKTGMKLSLSVTGEESLKGLPASLIGFKFDNYLVVDAQELEQETICALREKKSDCQRVDGYGIRTCGGFYLSVYCRF